MRARVLTDHCINRIVTLSRGVGRPALLNVLPFLLSRYGRTCVYFGQN